MIDFGAVPLTSATILAALNLGSSVALTVPVVVTLPAGATTKGINVSSTPAGTVAAVINEFNTISVTPGGIDAGVNAIAGLRVLYNQNNSTARADNGTFALFADILVDTTSTTALQSYCAFIGRAKQRVNTTGSGFSLTGINANVAIETNITGCAQISGFESDMTVETGANPITRVGYTTVLSSTDAVRGSTNDASFYWTAQMGSAVGWKDIFHLDASHGKIVDTDSNIMRMTGTATVNNGIDLSGWTITTNAFKSTDFSVNGAGRVTLNADRPIIFTSQTNGNGASLGTLTNAPAAGDPFFWVKCRINGFDAVFPLWPG